MALRLSALSTTALTGNTTLPVNKNSSTKVIAAITESTAGRREVIASELSRFVCAIPPICTSWPPGPSRCARARCWRRFIIFREER